jgi:hypothetical protein
VAELLEAVEDEVEAPPRPLAHRRTCADATAVTKPNRGLITALAYGRGCRTIVSRLPALSAALRAPPTNEQQDPGDVVRSLPLSPKGTRLRARRRH